MNFTNFQVIFFAIVHALKIGHHGRVIKLSQTLLESNSAGSGGSNGKVLFCFDVKCM